MIRQLKLYIEKRKQITLLNSLSDKILMDAGFNVDMVREGKLKTYPWRQD